MISRYQKISLISISIISLMTLTWTWLFSALDTPKDSERIQLFLATNEYREDLETDMESGLANVGVKDVIITAVAPDSPYFFTMLSTIGILDCDLLLLPETVITGIEDITNFAPLEENVLAEYDITASQYDYFTFGVYNYAIKIYDADSTNNLLDRYFSITSSDDYYLAINANTVNSGSYSKTAGTTSDHSFEALAFLLNEGTTL